MSSIKSSVVVLAQMSRKGARASSWFTSSLARVSTRTSTSVRSLLDRNGDSGLSESSSASATEIPAVTLVTLASEVPDRDVKLTLSWWAVGTGWGSVML